MDGIGPKEDLQGGNGGKQETENHDERNENWSHERRSKSGHQFNCLQTQIMFYKFVMDQEFDFEWEER